MLYMVPDINTPLPWEYPNHPRPNVATPTIYMGSVHHSGTAGQPIRRKKENENKQNARSKGKRVLGGQTAGRAHAVCIGATGTQGKCGQKAVSREARDEQPDDRTVSRSSWRALRTIRLMSTTLSTT